MVSRAKILEFPAVVDLRGQITVVEQLRHVPFRIERIFYFHDVPPDQIRGGHAHKEQHQCLICLSGSFSITVDNGAEQKTIVLDEPTVGLHLPPGIWASEQSFVPGTVCLVLTSAPYDEADYIRSYPEFLAWVGNETNSGASL